VVAQRANVMFGVTQLGLGLGLGIAAAYTVTAPWLPLAFTGDADVAAAVWSLLPLVIGMLPLNALVYVLDGVLLGASDFQFLAGAHVLHSRVSLHAVFRCSARHGIPRCLSLLLQ
jgi:Na+-driven multidrug efflux pump